MKFIFYSRNLLIFVTFGKAIVGTATAQQLSESPNNLTAPDQAWASHYSSGLAPSYDRAVDIVSDKSGNVYVTGYSSHFDSRYDYLTVKYDASGNQVWAVRYNGPGNGGDEAVAIAIDEAQNIYVTGESTGDGSSTDYATIKYDSDGVMKWVARYNGPANSRDEVVAFTIDEFGNVYVTGRSEGADTTFDFATVKYNADGEEQWVARRASPLGNHDLVTGIAVARSGNVYVTGISRSDNLTIKYNNSGAEQWIARYEGDWIPTAIVTDDSDNVYLTGRSYREDTNFDYTTIKYSKTGIEQWVRDYNGPDNLRDEPVDLVIDPAGNIYVTGESQDDIATVRYSSSGVEEWVVRYSQADYTREGVADIEIDTGGNIYVSGYGEEAIIVKYDANGLVKWAAIHEPPPGRDVYFRAITVDGSGNVLATGNSRGWGLNAHDNFETAKYDPAGQFVWKAQYDNQGNSRDEATAMTVDNDGNVYVTGWSLASGSGRDFLTIKYDNFGNEKWIKRYHATWAESDVANAITVDDACNVYVTGQSYQNTISSCTTIKYNASGQEQWIDQYWGPDSAYNGGQALMLGDDRNIYVTGSGTIKYDNSGAILWAIDKDDFIAGSEIGLDAAGNVYIRGGYIGKLDSAGTPQWSQPLGLNTATGFAVDDSGNVFTTGWFENGHGNSFYVTQKHNTNGDLQWNVTEQIHSGGRTDNMPAALAIDDSGNVYVTGMTISFYATVKYNRNGVRQWVAEYQESGYGRPVAMMLDANGFVYVTGLYNNNSHTANDYTTVKHDNNGLEQWVARFNSPRNSHDQPSAFFVDETGNVYVTGTSSFSTSSSGPQQSMYSTVKYIQKPVSVEDAQPNIPKRYELLQNYPNPFNPSTSIRYVISRPGHVRLKIYNLSGQEVASLVDEKKAPGAYEVRWTPGALASGLYLYRLKSGNFVATRKLILVK